MQLTERLAPYKAAQPDAGFAAWANSAYLDRINLSANGFYQAWDKQLLMCA